MGRRRLEHIEALKSRNLSTPSEPENLEKIGWRDGRKHRADAGLNGGMRVPMGAETCPLVPMVCIMIPVLATKAAERTSNPIISLEGVK